MRYTGHPRFFLGSDSAPHPYHKKSTSTPHAGCAAGIYTSPILLPLVATLLDSFGALDNLEGFVSENGRAFYGFGALPADGAVRLRKKVDGEGKGLNRVVDSYKDGGELEVVPFWAGRELTWEIVED